MAIRSRTLLVLLARAGACRLRHQFTANGSAWLHRGPSGQTPGAATAHGLGAPFGRGHPWTSWARRASRSRLPARYPAEASLSARHPKGERLRA